MKRVRFLFLAVLVGLSGAVRAAGAPVLLPPLPSGPLPAGDVAAAAPVSQPMVQRSSGGSFDLRFATVAFVVDFLYENAVKTPHVLAPEVLSDMRQVSFRYNAYSGDLRAFLTDFLGSLGYVVNTRGGVDFIVKRPEADKPREDQVPFVYSPLHRKADYLMRMVQPLVGGRFTTQRGVSSPVGAKGELSQDVPPQSAAGLIDQTSDELVFMGTRAEVATLKEVLRLVDTERGKVNLRAWVYEVTGNSSNQSGFSLVVSVLGSVLGINNGLVDPGAASIRLHAGNAINLGIQALDADSRFKVVTRPNLTVLSGERARLNVGQQVPTQGNVTFQGVAGTPVQSVVYQDAGVIFDVQPTVMKDTVELAVDEEISDFVRTTTGVNTSPTKNTRKLQTVTSMADGDVAVIGGLIQSHDSASTSGLSFLPKWANGHNDLKDKTEIVLVLQVTKI